MTWDGVERRKASYRRLIDCHPDFPCGDKNCVEPHPQRDLIAALRTPASGPGWTREELVEALRAEPIIMTVDDRGNFFEGALSLGAARSMADLFLGRSGAGVDSPKETGK